YHYLGTQAEEQQRPEEAEELFDRAAEYWKRAIQLAPNNYIEAQNWLKTTGRSSMDVYF
ncbi:MAG: photosystem I assembly protein Ycf3, partial [Thermosynechococcus sp.]